MINGMESFRGLNARMVALQKRAQAPRSEVAAMTRPRPTAAAALLLALVLSAPLVLLTLAQALLKGL